MTIFTTDRLCVNEIQENDKPFFIELLTAPEIIDPIPQQKWTLEEIIDKFNEFKNYEEPVQNKERAVWGIYELGKTEMIGLCGLLNNDAGQREIAYRFRSNYWGKGYGTEIAKFMIDYCFNELQLNQLSADINKTNTASVKILEKFFVLVNEFYNNKDKCTDRRYNLKREDWLA